MGYLCTVCGVEHPGPPWVWGPDAPFFWANLPSLIQEAGEISSDQCIVPEGDAVRCFVRGRLEIPVEGADEPFAWLVWVEVSGEDFRDIQEKWNLPGREQTPPYQGTLANRLPIYDEDSLNLAVAIQTRPIGDRPAIVVTAEHLLKREQTNGIPVKRVEEIAGLLSH